MTELKLTSKIQVIDGFINTRRFSKPYVDEFCLKKKKAFCFDSCVFFFMFVCLFADVMASVKLIPKPTEPRLLPKPGSEECVRCAVVGAAGILSGSKMGKEIDAHDYVFR